MNDKLTLRLDALEDFAKATLRAWTNGQLSKVHGLLYCSRCGGERRVGGELLHGRVWDDSKQALMRVSCVQCDATWLVVWYKLDDRPVKEAAQRLVVLPLDERSGATPHTPPDVAYYLDQAHRSQSVGANSAAVAMYRAAVEQTLLQQGYQARMLGPKLAELEAAIKAGTAPKWAMDIDTEYLDILKDLGNASIHAGDPSKQSTFDADLLTQLGTTMHGLLWHVYEVQHEKQAHLDSMRAARAKVKK